MPGGNRGETSQTPGVIRAKLRERILSKQNDRGDKGENFPCEIRPGEIGALFSKKPGEMRALFHAFDAVSRCAGVSYQISHIPYPFLYPLLSTT